MASILDAAVLVGRETTYGTAGTLARAYEAQADTWKYSSEMKESVGLGGGFHTTRADRIVNTPMGGEGSILVDFLEVGMGQLLQASFGTSSQAVVSGAAYKQTHTTDADSPGDSFTVQVQRPDVAGTLNPFTYVGSVVTGWSITQGLDDYLKFEWSFDARDVVTNVTNATPVYPDARPMFWTTAGIEWGGSSICMEEFSLTADLGLKTDRRCLNGQPLKKIPIRQSVPTFEGSMSGEFANMDAYNDFKANTVRELIVTWTGSEIGSTGTDHQLKLTMPAVQLTGDTPTVNLGDTPQQPMPFKVLHDAAEGAAITCEYTTTQDTLVV